MDISQNLLCLFTGQLEERDGSYVIEVPQQEIAVGDVDVGDIYRVAVLQHVMEASTTESEPASKREQKAGPPVETGDVLDVEIEDIGDQGDGVARVGPGYVIIVPGAERDERVAVEITDVRENMAFAEVVERYDRES